MGETTEQLGVSLHFDDGEMIHAWTNWSHRDSYTDPLGSLELTIKPVREALEFHRNKLRKGRLVTFKIDDVSQGGFLIQTRTMKVDSGDGCVITVTCQSPLVTPYQGGIDPDMAFHKKEDTAALDVIQQALAPYGFETFTADAAANVGALTGKSLSGRKQPLVITELKHKDAAAQWGEAAYAFISRITSRLAFCLRPSVDGTIIMAGAPDYEQAACATVGQTFGDALPAASDRFLSHDVTDTNDGQFSECVVVGERSEKRGEKETGRPIARVATSGGFENTPKKVPFEFVDATILDAGRHHYSGAADACPYKPLFIEDKHARDNQRCRSVALLAMGLRGAKGYTVTGEVAGLRSASGHLWQVDTVVRVILEAEGTDEDMWVSEVVRSGDKDSGQRTRLTLIPLNALILGELPS